MPKRTAIHTWRAYKIRKKMEFVGLVRAATEQEAIEAGCEDYHIPANEKHRGETRRMKGHRALAPIASIL